MENKNYIYVAGFLILLVLVGAYLVNKIPNPQSQKQNDLSQLQQSSDNINASGSAQALGLETSSTPVATASGANKVEDKLQIQDELIGTGSAAVAGKKVTVNYTGKLTNGTVFDSSLNSGRTPFTFNLGAGEVIKGWDLGVAGMKVGGKRILTIPPSLGYGSQDMGSIPPNSTLIFEVELLKVE